MRFSPDARRPRTYWPARRGAGLGGRVRLAATLGGALLVLAAMGRLRQPETHRALARALGEPAAAAPAEGAPLGPPLVGPADLAGVKDNAPFRAGEQAAWFATIAAVRDAGAEGLAAQSAAAIGYAPLNAQPDAYRGRVVTVSGSVRRVEEVAPAANDLGVERLWRVTIAPTGGEVWPITVYALAEPPAVGSDADAYDASAVGVFFKKLSYRYAKGIGTTPVVVAPRIETPLAPLPPPQPGAAPVAAQAELAVDLPEGGSVGRGLLAELGFAPDWGDAIRDRRALLPAESDAFYALLGAVRRTPAAQLVRLARLGLDGYAQRRAATQDAPLRARQEARAVQEERVRGRYSAAPLFGDGRRERGELVLFDAVVRRAVRVEAAGSGAAQQHGVDHYYELEAFPEDSQNLPIVFVVRDLPAGFPVGDAIRQPARLAGFFFKQWAYRTRIPGSAPGDDVRQFAPLLVGRAPIPLATPSPTEGRPGGAVGVVAGVGLLVVALAVWRAAQSDRRYARQTLRRFRPGANTGTAAGLDSEP